MKIVRTFTIQELQVEFVALHAGLSNVEGQKRENAWDWYRSVLSLYSNAWWEGSTRPGRNIVITNVWWEIQFFLKLLFETENPCTCV